jgi:hypothetical protein
MAVRTPLNLYVMKKLMLMAALAFVVSATQAQESAPTKTPEEKASMKVNHLSKKYQLTQDQQARLQPELVKTELTIAQKQEAARQARQEMNQAQKAQETAILEVMDPEQKARFQADKLIRKEKSEPKRSKHKGRLGQPAGE